jgi:hypothetical protein
VSSGEQWSGGGTMDRVVSSGGHGADQPVQVKADAAQQEDNRGKHQLDR